jgi:hypothetical protein
MSSKMAAAIGATILLVGPFAAGAGETGPLPGPRVAALHHAAGGNARRPHDSESCSGVGSNSFVGGGTANYAYGTNATVVAGQSNAVCDDESAIVAGENNTVSSNGFDAALFSFIGGGSQNDVSGVDSVIGAGVDNKVSSEAATIVAGLGNSISGDYGLIGSGDSNQIETSNEGVIGGGTTNTIVAQNVGETAYSGGSYSVIGGGAKNSIVGNADGKALYSALGGGYGNAITATYAAIAGGFTNRATGVGASVGGGENNLAYGAAAAIPGGYHNVASGTASFAAGYTAQAAASGSFVWSDTSSTSVHVISTTADQFLARAAGGVYFYSNPSLTSGVRLSPGSGTWSSLSDRHMKTGIVQVDDSRILDKLASLPVSEWSYTSERGVRHIGPMAQDFYAAFKVGEDDRHITTIDEDGVALAAVKALHAENAVLRARNASLADRVESLETGQAELRRDVESMRVRLNRAAR